MQNPCGETIIGKKSTSITIIPKDEGKTIKKIAKTKTGFNKIEMFIHPISRSNKLLHRIKATMTTSNLK